MLLSLTELYPKNANDGLDRNFDFYSTCHISTDMSEMVYIALTYGAAFIHAKATHMQTQKRQPWKCFSKSRLLWDRSAQLLYLHARWTLQTIWVFSTSQEAYVCMTWRDHITFMSSYVIWREKKNMKKCSSLSLGVSKITDFHNLELFQATGILQPLKIGTFALYLKTALGNHIIVLNTDRYWKLTPSMPILNPLQHT